METGKLKKMVLEVLIIFGLSGAVWAQWTTPVPLTEVNTEYTERTPFLSFDGLTLYFCRQDTGSFYYTRIYKASRSEPFGLFTAVEEVSELNYSGGHVSSPWVSPDNLRMYYNRTESGDYWRFKFSERASVDVPWSVGSNISELNALAQHAARPRLSEDELIIVFHSAEISGGEGGYDIWMATRADRYSVFGNVTNLAEVNTSANDKEAFISDDGLTLYFASDRNGVDQIFKARRSSRAEAFGTLEHLAVFDTALGSTCPAISADRTEFFFAARDPVNEKLDIHVSYSVEPNLVAHWTFDEGAGTIAYDSANGYDGIIYGAQWTTGQLGSALWFDGIDDYVQLPQNNPVWLPMNDFTLSLWVYFERDLSEMPREFEYIIDLNHGDSAYTYNELGYGIRRDRNNGKVMFAMTMDSATDENLFSQQNLTPGTWYHIVAIRNNTSQAIYVNGQLDATRTCPAGPIDFVGGYDNDEVSIGRFSRYGGQPFNFALRGAIDEVCIYDRALSPEEISQLYSIEQRVAVDIRPGSCPNLLNLSSRGVLPVAILGSEELDVNSIDVTSIRLEGIAPMRSGYEDVAAPVAGGEECDCTVEGTDGYTDLTLKFQTQAVVARLLDEYTDLAKNDVVVLTLTGVLTDQTPIEGEDCIIIKGKYRSR